MKKGVNKVIIVGNLGKDPELRHLPNGDAVTSFSASTGESWKDKDGNQQERTEWHNIVIFKRLAEIAAEYLKKGSKVYLEGSLRTRKWQDQSGQDRYTTEIIATEMQMLDGKQYGQQAAPAQQQRTTNRQSAPQNRTAPPPQQAAAFDDFDDDSIPF